MLIYIRADASNLIGSGHIMRCLTLADMLKKEGHKVIFICRDLPGNFSDLITQRGYLCRLLQFSAQQKKHYLSLPCQDNYPAWLGVSSQDDATETIEYLQDKSADLLVVDHYSLDYVWEKACQPYCKKIMVIDDLANRQHHCDIILDHNFYSNAKSRYNNLVPEACKKLLGPKYALLCPKLRQIKINREQKNKGMQPETIDNIVIFMGGMDPQNYTDKALAMAIKSPHLKHALFHIVLGKHNSHKLALKQKYAAYDNIVFHIQPDYYFTLLENANLAIGAGGVAQLERMYINLPSVVTPIAENQQEAYLDMLQEKMLLPLDQLNNNSIHGAFNCCNVKAVNISDLFKHQPDDVLTLRLACLNDAKLLYQWRNHPKTRKYFFDTSEISYDTHYEWMKSSLLNKNRVIYIILKDNLPIGVVRFDIDSTSAITDVYLDPTSHGLGYGKQSLVLAIKTLQKTRRNIRKIIAQVLEQNVPSRNLFISLNFKTTYRNYELDV